MDGVLFLTRVLIYTKFRKEARRNICRHGIINNQPYIVNIQSVKFTVAGTYTVSGIWTP